MQFHVNEADKQRVREEDDRQVVRFIWVEVRVVGEGIRTGQEMSWDIDDFEVKISKVEQPSCLMTIEVLRLMEVHQVLVIYKDLDREEGAMEIMSLGFQGADDCKEFSVVDIVVSFHRDE